MQLAVRIALDCTTHCVGPSPFSSCPSRLGSPLVASKLRASSAVLDSQVRLWFTTRRAHSLWSGLSYLALPFSGREDASRDPTRDGHTRAQNPAPNAAPTGERTSRTRQAQSVRQNPHYRLGFEFGPKSPKSPEIQNPPKYPNIPIPGIRPKRRRQREAGELGRGTKGPSEGKRCT